MSSRLSIEIHEQKLANESTLPFADLYASHRAHLTAQVLRAGGQAGSSVCLLGAGNCQDIDLPALSSSFAEIHLVDIDQAALSRARSRLDAAERAKVHCHAPIDLGGLLNKLERWQRFEVTPQELVEHPELTAQQLAESIGGPFDLVVSSCVLTQMQLSVLNVLTDQHRLFAAVRHTLTVTHLRTLSRLTRNGGRALLATDLVDAARLGVQPDSDAQTLRALFDEAIAAGNVIYVAHPGVFKAVINDDPVLARELSPSEIQDVWLWQQGPSRSFLVYAMDLIRADRDAGRAA